MTVDEWSDDNAEGAPVADTLLEEFVAQGLIAGVLLTVKSGKEATVYCCRGGAALGSGLVAAKVYRPVAMRGFKNDAIYRQGHVILDSRHRRAFETKTRFGREVQLRTWVGYEFETLWRLYAAGAAVPRPIAQAGDAILMEYIGDESGPAPMLHRVALPPDEARRLFDLAMRNIETLLACDRVHGDLSAYNILYWNGSLTIIDLPQAVNPWENRSAFDLLARDITNLCKHWTRYGVYEDPNLIATQLWRRFMR